MRGREAITNSYVQIPTYRSHTRLMIKGHPDEFIIHPQFPERTQSHAPTSLLLETTHKRIHRDRYIHVFMFPRRTYYQNKSHFTHLLLCWIILLSCHITSSAFDLGRNQKQNLDFLATKTHPIKNTDTNPYSYSKQPRTRTMSTSEPNESIDAPACAPNSNSGKCVPCESLDTSHLLSSSQIESELSPLWTVSPTDDTNTPKLTRSYTARNFQAALNSLNAIGKIAERENHHPDLHLTGYRNVTIVLYTHSVGGITANDVRLAQMLDEEVTVEYSPKWLKDHPEAKREEEG